MYGFLTWIAAGILAFAAARTVRAGRAGMAWIELAIGIAVAVAAGMAATALDFGGWNEPDIRAAAFAFFTAATFLGAIRAIRLLRRNESR